MRSFSEYLNEKKMQYGDKFDSSELDKRFIPYFENGQRIEVETMGMRKRGTIGITTGWRPAFLLMLTKRSLGSSYTLGKDDKIVNIPPKRKCCGGYHFGICK